jgi:hypothetical protein
MDGLGSRSNPRPRAPPRRNPKSRGGAAQQDAHRPSAPRHAWPGFPEIRETVMLMLFSCYALLPTPHRVPAFGTVQPTRSTGLRSGTAFFIQARGRQASGDTAIGGRSTGGEWSGQSTKQSRCRQLKMGSKAKQLPPEQENPLKWPPCANLGRKLCDSVLPALRLLASDGRSSDKAGATTDPRLDSPQGIEAARQTAMAELDVAADWLNAPCCATVKLDGTNVGIDGRGLLVGRNYVVPPEERYQKVDVHALLSKVPAQIKILTDELEATCRVHSSKQGLLRRWPADPAFDEWLAGGAILQVMLYGELIVNQGKYDYEAAGIFRQWFCFGVLISPSTPMDSTKYVDYVARLAATLQAAGYNCHQIGQPWDLQPLLRIGPNEKLMRLLYTVGISTVSHDYQPRMLTEVEGAQGPEETPANGIRLPRRFASLRELILSEWASQFFMPAAQKNPVTELAPQGQPLGEGLVVCSEPGGELTKWKHGGEEAPAGIAGNTPDKLAEAVELLHGLQGNSMLPPGLLEVCERLQLVATSGAGPKKTKAAGKKEKQQIKAKADKDALAVWASTLTKVNTLETTFAKGLEAKAALEGTLIAQVALDLEADYGYEPSKALARAAGVVRTEMGKRYGQWKRETSRGE